MVHCTHSLPPPLHMMESYHTLNQNRPTFLPPSSKRSPANQSIAGYHVRTWKGRWPDIKDSVISGAVIITRFMFVTYYDSINRSDVNDQGMVGMCGNPLGWPSQGQTGPPSCSYDPGRLRHDSWFLSQPYHVGLPQSTHRLPDGQAAPLPPSVPQANPTSNLLAPVSSFHQVVCTVHHNVFESYQLPSGKRELLNVPIQPAGCSYSVPSPVYNSPQQLEQYLPIVPMSLNHVPIEL